MHTPPICYAFLVVAVLLVVKATHGTDARTIPPLGGELASDERSGFSCGSFESVTVSTAQWLRCVLHKRDWDVVLSTYLSVAICRRRHGAEATADVLAVCRQKPIGRPQLLALVANNTQVVLASQKARKDGAPSQNSNPSEELMQSDQPQSAPSMRSSRRSLPLSAAAIARIEHQKVTQQEEAEIGEHIFYSHQSRAARRYKRTGNRTPYWGNVADMARNGRASSRRPYRRRSTTPFIITTTTTTPVPTSALFIFV